MRGLDQYNIDIYKLSNAEHEYDFEVADEFFTYFEGSRIEHGKATVHVTLDKRETLITMSISIEGTIELICDRSLDSFDMPIHVDEDVIFKYGEEEKEIDDNIVMITSDTQRINIAQLIYDLLGIQIPIKCLHPRYQDENDTDEIVYTDQSEENDTTDEAVDPRWEALKKINRDN